MRAREFTQIDEMAKATGGLNYEKSVADTLKRILPNFKEHVKFVNMDCGTAGFCNVGVDLELDVDGNDFNIEIKQNTRAQMGGTSVRYNADTDVAEIVNSASIDEEAKPLFIAAVKTKKEDIIRFVDFIRIQEPVELNGKVKYKIPLSGITEDAWNASVKNGLLGKLSSEIKFKDTSIISSAYNKKGVYYIQIGGAGLFYLNKNPYNLPIPNFSGEIEMEIRLGRAGGTFRKFNGGLIKVVGGSYRCQGRLKTKIKSDLSLDNDEHAIKIITQIIAHNRKNAGNTVDKKIPAPTKQEPVKKTAPEKPVAPTTQQPDLSRSPLTAKWLSGR
jgi:hypothetical protein